MYLKENIVVAGNEHTELTSENLLDLLFSALWNKKRSSSTAFLFDLVVANCFHIINLIFQSGRAIGPMDMTIIFLEAIDKLKNLW